MWKQQVAMPLMVLALLVAVTGPVWAADGVDASLVADRTELTVGEVVGLTLEVSHPAGYQVIVPQLEPVWGDFEVRSQSPVETTVHEDGTATTRQRIEVTLFSLGEFETPALALTLRDGSGQLVEETIPSVALQVVPTLAEDDNELRDIKPQAALAMAPGWPWMVGGLAAASFAAALGWWAYRRRKGESLGMVDNRPAWRVAYDTLDTVADMRLLETGRIKEHYTLVTDVLRAYLEGQFHLRVFDRTTSELRSILSQSELQMEHARRFLQLFGESDLVKFAKYAPDQAPAEQLIEEARKLVDLTRPQPESELEEFLGEGRDESKDPRAPRRLSRAQEARV
jgi:hypothetical protein